MEFKFESKYNQETDCKVDVNGIRRSAPNEQHD